MDLGIASVVGGVGGSALDFIGAERANSAAKRSADKQMDFQERMSNSSYQRQMLDLKAAGLNPMLAYMSGGASSPSGAGYVPQNSLAGTGRNLAEMSGRMSQAKLAKAGVMESASRIRLQDEQAEAARQSARKASEEADIANFSKYRIGLENEFYRDNPWYIKAQKYMDAFGSMLSTGRDAALIYRGLKGFSGSSESFGPQGEHRGTNLWKRR